MTPADRSVRPVLVVATLEEATHLPGHLPTILTGFGKASAAVAVARWLAQQAASGGLDGVELLNVGSAGALRDGLEGLHVPGQVLNHDLNGDVIRALGFDPEDVLDVTGGDDTVLATGDSFVADPAKRELLAARAHLVDMEGYAVVLAAARFGVPVRLVKHVSDNADEGSMAWVDLVHHSARALGEWVEEHLC